MSKTKILTKCKMQVKIGFDNEIKPLYLYYHSKFWGQYVKKYF